VVRPYIELAKSCSVRGCKKPFSAKGYCKTHYLLEWKKKNPEKVEIIQRKYYENNRAEILEGAKKYKEKNSDKIRKRRKEYYAKNKKR